MMECILISYTKHGMVITSVLSICFIKYGCNFYRRNIYCSEQLTEPPSFLIRNDFRVSLTTYMETNSLTQLLYHWCYVGRIFRPGYLSAQLRYDVEISCLIINWIMPVLDAQLWVLLPIRRDTKAMPRGIVSKTDAQQITDKISISLTHGSWRTDPAQVTSIW